MDVGGAAMTIKREVIAGKKCIHEECGCEKVVVARVHKNGSRMLECTKCHRQFSENTGTPFYNLRTPLEKILLTLKAVIDGGGIRAAERITGVHRDTVTKWLILAGKHVEEVEKLMVTGIIATEIQMDELWTFVLKKTNIPVKNYEKNGEQKLKK